MAGIGIRANQEYGPKQTAESYKETDNRCFINKLVGAISILGYDEVLLYLPDLYKGANNLRENLIALDCFEVLDCRKDLLTCRQGSINSEEPELARKLKALTIWGNARLINVNSARIIRYADISPIDIEVLRLNISKEKAQMFLKGEKFKNNDDKFLEALEEPAKQFCLKRSR